MSEWSIDRIDEAKSYLYQELMARGFIFRIDDIQDWKYQVDENGCVTKVSIMVNLNAMVSHDLDVTDKGYARVSHAAIISEIADWIEREAPQHGYAF